MVRRLVTALSLALCAAACATWAASYHRPRMTGHILPRGAWRVIPWRGQLVMVHHHGTPEFWDRHSWGTTTVYLSADPSNEELNELTKTLVYDPAAPWDDRNRPAFIAARPYLLGRLASGCRVRNAGGFGLLIQSLPSSVPASKQIGPVVESLAVPFWLLAVIAAALPLHQLFTSALRRRRRCRSLCTACCYNLTANASGICPECGIPTRSFPGATRVGAGLTDRGAGRTG